MKWTHLYVYIHEEIYEGNLTKLLSYLRVMAFQVIVINTLMYKAPTNQNT